MRHGRFRTGFRASDLEGHDRFSSGRSTQCRSSESTSVADGFDIQRDHLSRRIIHQPVNEIGQFQIDFVACRNKFGQADTARRRARKQRTEDTAALRDDANRASREMIHLQRTRRRQHHTIRNVDQADRVGPENPH